MTATATHIQQTLKLMSELSAFDVDYLVMHVRAAAASRFPCLGFTRGHNIVTYILAESTSLRYPDTLDLIERLRR